MQKHDITTKDDVRLFVDTFYDRVRKDELLFPVFNERIKNNWPQHLERMYSFWNTVLLGEYEYQGAPFMKHANLPVDHKHFTTWLKLFNEVIDELFAGTKAEEAKWRAGKMAQLFEFKIEHSRKGPFKSII